MIIGHAYLDDKHICLEFKSEDKEELMRMKKIVMRLAPSKVLITDDHENQFKVRIDRRDKQVAQTLLEHAGDGQRIGYDIGVSRELYDYLELKWR